MSLEDRRQSPRVDVQRLVVRLPDGDLDVSGNLGTGGVGFEIESDLGLSVGDELTVQLFLSDDEDPFFVSAEVRHLRDADDGARLYVGAQFVDVDVLVENPLFRFVEENAVLLATAAPEVHAVSAA